jgi:hypothetical protein
MRKWAKGLCLLMAASAAYGFAAGSVHSLLYAARNLIKFPLLILVTTVICSLAYYLFARFASAPFTFGEVQGAVTRIFRNLSVLLASLAPVVYFLARTIEQPTARDLGEYPLFLGFNVLIIAVCGCIAVVRLAQALLRQHRLRPWRAWSIVGIWLLLSFLVGSQWAWYLRPFFGVSSVEITPFCLGTDPDFRGATSFYEAVFHILAPPAA